MKKTRIIYWGSTVIVCLTMIFSSYSDLRSDVVKEAFGHLGFPGYFRVQLGIMKIVGIILLAAPLPNRFKEWAYAGFTITFISAFIAHSASGDPAGNRIAPLIVLTFLLVSYFSFHKKITINNK
jgi:uncharacterized membrane protein YphA (DoxX/SURF4 family)